ncbi:ATP-binding cassette domain-containing protein [Paenibacillus hodogayensis]|uniref:ATP-binding cassette domain-containing protein n=1 Tax=Paenibacillus hodogayensis TaxID=279208 RepID=A0ABV5W7R9_9BACL
MVPIWTLKDADLAAASGDEAEAVLKRLVLTIREGEFVAVIGRNGSGKSTLLRVLGGLVPLRGGELAVGGSGRSIGMVFQNPDAQLVGETVYEDVCFGLENAAVPAEEMPERARTALASVGLNVAPDEPVENLSGGQKQLLSVAGAIVTGARALLLDEPTAMLDPASKRNVLEAVCRLHEGGTTVVWSTQAMDEIGYADRVIALDGGRLVFDGTPEQFLYGDFRPGESVDEDGELLPCPCRTLGFRLPYPVEVAHRLVRSGVPLRTLPLHPDQLLEAVDSLCR